MPDPLYQVKLLSALRSGNPALIHPFLAEIGLERRSESDSESSIATAAAALHLAIRCASLDTVSLLLSNRAITPNAVHPHESGTTALHLAASLGRVDVVGLLLEQEDIDDTLRDAQGRTVKDVARGRDVLHIIQDSQSLLTASYRSHLRTYILSPPTSQPPPALLGLLRSPRVRLLNLSYLDSDSGTTLLHEASRRRDLQLIELAVKGGADVFVRDRKGRTVQDVVGKDERMRALLRQFASRDTTLLEDAQMSGPPDLRGYLNKYTNVARGWGTRWFVLKDGILSYYRHQEDETVASRGSIAMKTAVLRIPASDRLRFEVHSTPSHGHHSVQKWFMKANHPVEASRWTQAIGRAIEYAKRGQAAPADSIESDTASNIQSIRSGSIRSSIMSVPRQAHRSRSDADSMTSSNMQTEDEDGARPHNLHGLHSEKNADTNPHDDKESGELNFEHSSDAKQPPHENNFNLHASSIVTQLDLCTRLYSSFIETGDSSAKTKESQAALKESLGSVRTAVGEFVDMAKERDEWWRSRLAHEQQRQSLWEESLQSVVKEGEEMERELREQARSRRRSRTGITSEGGSSTLRRGRSALVISPTTFEETPESPPKTPGLSRMDTASTVTPQTSLSPSAIIEDSERQKRRQLSLSSSTLHRPTKQLIYAELAGSALSPPLSAKTVVQDEVIDVDTDDEDEFFDAIETNALPNLVINEALTSHAPVPSSSKFRGEQYVGYQHPRESLPIKNDDRPPTSLWSVLKHSIGKDLTKISFPVFFNEPTSMLQRMAEDMEFSECLDAASQEPDPLRRIAFVAAFAMSNYSSTIGRIAKPFNPMLSETFEYVNLEKEYRYVSEQVSHHPPISACWAESTRWNYFGEVDAQNRFTGKSFEIRPTGVAHTELFIPAEWGPGYPEHDHNDRLNEGPKVVEHYSWKKVTTQVSGFLLGQPTIDHYGEMTIKNHRTSDTCVLTFKPRGWRAKDSFEISGYVADRLGNLQYEIAGRWNSQLVARAAGAGSGMLSPDVDINDGPRSPSRPPEFILLWRNSHKPVAPFHLTPFAITLNDCPRETLRPFLAPTDCRLRPDQRAFEIGRYERANVLKQKQEERQRAVRKARETGTLGSHQPRWFVAETERDTGERYWAPVRVNGGRELGYWAEREKAFASHGASVWKDVEPIFIEDEP